MELYFTIFSLSLGVIVEYEGSEAAAKDVAMHIAANKPIGMNSKDVPESVIAAERYVMKKKNDFTIWLACV